MKHGRRSSQDKNTFDWIDTALGRGAAGSNKSASTANGEKWIVAVFSRDESIVGAITESISDSWAVETFADPHESRGLTLKPGVRIVVIDDEQIDESTRGWLLKQVRMRAPKALVAYVTAAHSLETERRVRACRVQYYTSKPIDRELIAKVLRSFQKAAR